MYTTGYDYGYNYGATAGAAAGAGFAALIGMYIAYIIVYAVYLAAFIVGEWKVLVKAGKPGWYSLIPIYNYWVLYELGDQKGFWCIVPVASIIFGIKACLSIAKKFGKSTGFAVLLMLLTPVGLIMLGFGKDKYKA